MLLAPLSLCSMVDAPPSTSHLENAPIDQNYSMADPTSLQPSAIAFSVCPPPAIAPSAIILSFPALRTHSRTQSATSKPGPSTT